MRLIAEKAFSFPIIGGAPLQPGDQFDVNDAEADVLKRAGLAIEAPSKRKYQRRDMQAEDNADAE